MLQRTPYERCPLCDAPEYETIGTYDCSSHPLYQHPIPSKITWLRCVMCQHVYTDGYFGDEINEVLFSRAQPGQLAGTAVHAPEINRLVSSHIIEKVCEHLLVRPYVPGSPLYENWLDVGFGAGDLLLTAHEHGFRATGIDARDECVKRLREFGITALTVTSLANYVQIPSYDVISMADVIEHCPFPKKELEAAHSLLLPGGCLFLSCPNMGSLLWNKLGDNNPYWREIEHFHNFSRERLYSLLEETGFVPVRFGVSERYRLGMEIIARVK